MNKEIVATNVILNYPALIGPQNFNGEKRYQTLIMIAKTDDELLSEVSDAIDDAEKNEAMADHYYMRVSTKTKPLVINQEREELTAIDDIYSGVIASVVFRLYAYSFAPRDADEIKYGIKGELIGLVKIADSKRINNAISATSLLDKVMRKTQRHDKAADNETNVDDTGYINPFGKGSDDGVDK